MPHRAYYVYSGKRAATLDTFIAYVEANAVRLTHTLACKPRVGMRGQDVQTNHGLGLLTVRGGPVSSNGWRGASLERVRGACTGRVCGACIVRPRLLGGGFD